MCGIWPRGGVRPGRYPQPLPQVCDFASLAPAELDAVMAITDVSSVWGIGRKTAPKLQDAGIRTVLDLKHADAAALGGLAAPSWDAAMRKENRTMCCLDQT